MVWVRFYLVQNPTMPRRDALKFLSAEFSGGTELRARFLREDDVESRLEHPNIVSIYRRGLTEDGHLWIAMQFVDGVNADAALQAGTMTPERAIAIVTESAKALDYAHRHHVIHRDVKPSNLLLFRQGGIERVLLSDSPARLTIASRRRPQLWWQPWPMPPQRSCPACPSTIEPTSIRWGARYFDCLRASPHFSPQEAWPKLPKPTSSSRHPR